MTSKKRHRFRNPFPGLFWALLATSLAGAVAALVYAFNPGLADLAVAGSVSDRSYRFSRLDIARPYFRLEAASGHIVPVTFGDEIRGAYILGLGSYEFSPPPHLAEAMESDIGHSIVRDSFDAVFIPLTYQEVEHLRYISQAVETTAAEPLTRTADLLAADRDEIAFGPPLGHSRLLSLGSVSFYALIHGQRLGTVRYAESSALSLRFLTLGGKEVLLPNPDAADEPSMLSALSRPVLLPISLAVYGANLVILFGLAYVLTLDLEHPEPVRRLRSRQLDLAVFALGLVFMEATYLLVTERLGITYRDPGVLYGLFGLLIVAFLFRQRLPLSAAGVTHVHFGRSVLVGLLLGTLAPIAMTMALPRGLVATDFAALAVRIPLSLLTVGLLQSFYLHGFLQSSLERLIGGPGGLFATAAIAALVAHIPLLMTWNPNQGLHVLQPLFLHPVATLFSGYLYSRTRNLASVVVLRTLLDIIPRLFIF